MSGFLDMFHSWHAFLFLEVDVSVGRSLHLGRSTPVGIVGVKVLQCKWCLPASSPDRFVLLWWHGLKSGKQKSLALLAPQFTDASAWRLLITSHSIYSSGLAACWDAWFLCKAALAIGTVAFTSGVFIKSGGTSRFCRGSALSEAVCYAAAFQPARILLSTAGVGSNPRTCTGTAQ